MKDLDTYLRDIDGIRRKIRSKFGIMEITKSNIEYYRKKHESHQYFTELEELWRVVETMFQTLLISR